MASKPKSTIAAPSYKPGHIVYLRSGGPEMVIESIEPNGDLNCIWFATGGEVWELPCRYRFPKPGVQLAVDGDLVNSRTGRYVDEDGILKGPDEPHPSLRKLDTKKRRKPGSRAKF